MSSGLARTAGVSLIIPAYNEGERIADVIRTAADSDLFSRVVAVDDGSSDNTAQAARDAGVEVIVHQHNQGKAQAMLSGLKATVEPVVAFLDADLLELNKEHIAALVNPVAEGRAEATLGVFRSGRQATTLAQKLAPMLSGQRCLRRYLLEDFNYWDTRFGIETELNLYLKRRGVEQKVVYWDGASHVMKEEKRGWLKGIHQRFKMYLDILGVYLRRR